MNEKLTKITSDYAPKTLAEFVREWAIQIELILDCIKLSKERDNDEMVEVYRDELMNLKGFAYCTGLINDRLMKRLSYLIVHRKYKQIKYIVHNIRNATY